MGTFVIKKDTRTQQTISLHPTLIKTFRLNNRKDCFIQFGTKRIKVSLHLTSKLVKNKIVMSTDCIDSLCIPDFPEYEIRCTSNVVVIGPFIGILLASTNRNLQKKLKRLNQYVANYDLFSGAILAFSVEGIDTVKQRIRGFIFNPHLKNWEIGEFLYPSAIFRRIHISATLRNHFLSHIGNNIFNSHYFSKWNMHRCLTENPQVSKHLPTTKLYRRPDDLIKFLDSNQTALLKPIHGLKGRNITAFEKREKDYFVRDRKNNRNYIQQIPNKEISDYLLKNIRAGKYIIQQKLNLTFQEERVVDFRLFVLKNQAGVWNCLGWIGREGVQGSVVSNRSSGGTVVDGDSLLEKILNLHLEELANWKEKIFSLACLAAKGMEQKSTNYGYFAIDMAIDRDQHIWIIEINHRSPNDGLPLYVGNHQLYQEIKTYNMLYAKFLSGFPNEK